jgi:hypothetical protein
MPIDLTGGLPIAREYVFAEPPTTPGMRDAVNMWIWDDRGDIGLPRVAVEAVAPAWDTHEIQINATLPGGRILREWGSGPAHPTRGPQGLPTRFGAGPLDFECIEPFRRFRATCRGKPIDTSFTNQAKGLVTTRRVDLLFEVECEMVVPPWVQGEMSEDAANKLTHSIEGAFMGGDRYEQLFRAQGRLVVDGQEHKFTGGGLRIRRQGVRNISGFWGHCWQSTVFPSGRAFGYIAYPPRPDGQPSYNEGYIFSGDGRLTPATVVEAPWLTRLCDSGENVSLVLESKLGRTRIEAQTVMSAPHISPPGARDSMPPLVQSIVRYRWDGEQAYGMMERSNLPERVTPVE